MLKALWRRVNIDYDIKQNIFFVTNVVFMVLGMCTLGAGVWLYIDRNEFLELTPSSHSAMSSAGLCCFTGATVCIICFVGCFAVWTGNRCILKTVIFFVAFLLLAHIVVGCTGFYHRQEAQQRIHHELITNINRSELMTKYGFTIQMKTSWAHLQRKLKCCGVDGPRDWHRSVHWPVSDFVPDSCCDLAKFASLNDSIGCGKAPDREELIYSTGCFPVFADWLYHHIRVVNYLVLILACAEIVILGTTVAIYLDIGRHSNEKCRTSHRRRRLEEINRREQEEVRMMPMDRIGDAAKDPDDP